LLALRSSALDEVKLDLLIAHDIAGNCLDSEGLDRNKLDEVLINCMKFYSDYNNVSFVISNVCDNTTLNLLKKMGINQFQGDVLCPFISASEMNGWLSQYLNPSKIK
jgi:EAL domain-containing protein (putative c-di-GMP-specific phosphodiesterase class I)